MNNEPEKYLAEEEIERLKQDEGWLIARVRIPDHIYHLICDYCNSSLIGECYAGAYYIKYHPRGYGYPHEWYLKFLFCPECGKKWGKDSVFVDNCIIPGLQAYLEWYLSLLFEEE